MPEGSPAPPARGKARNQGTGSPASAIASRWASLFAVRRAASGGFRGRPSRSAARAAITAVPSSTGTTPAIGSCSAARAISAAASSGFR